MSGKKKFFEYLEAFYEEEVEDEMQAAELVSLAVPDGLSDASGAANTNVAPDGDTLAPYVGNPNVDSFTGGPAGGGNANAWFTGVEGGASVAGGVPTEPIDLWSAYVDAQNSA